MVSRAAMGNLAPPCGADHESGMTRQPRPLSAFARGKAAIVRRGSRGACWLRRKAETLLLLATLGVVALWLAFWFGP